VARRNPQGGYTIAAGEVGAFSVCPQSWFLSFSKSKTEAPPTARSILGQALHRDWSKFFEESLTFGTWVRYLAMLVCMMLVVFIFVSPATTPIEELFKLSPRNRGLQLLLLLTLCAWLMRIFLKEQERRRAGAGFSRSEVTLAIDGGVLLPEREYVSISQGLAGKPDALVKEGEIIVPVERKPLAKKLRDRYVAQLLVYMRLVEEFEGARPPHGYLLLGPTCRRITVVNSVQKQEWLSSMLEEMRAILEGAPPKPLPHPRKCAGCEVRARCSARADIGRFEV
jgi:CRISPR-associated protein Cas4